jgi:peptidoglycan/LPS O-acetylase OafA/YrhL
VTPAARRALTMRSTVDRPRLLAPVPALDGVRAVAVALVVAFHFEDLSGGFLGVDLFFALSGFLITTLLLDEHATSGRIALGAFWARRARRLLPALALMLAGTLVAIAVLFDADSLAANRNEALASAFWVSNWYQVAHPAPYLTVFQHTWSLAIEAQFYAIWPLVTIAVLRGVGAADRRTAAGRVLVASVVGVALSAVAMIAQYQAGASLARVYLGTDTRVGPILFGAALAALLARRGAPLPPPARRVLDLAGLVALVLYVVLACVVSRPDGFLYQGLYPLVIGPAATVIVAAAFLGDGWSARVLALPPLRAIGLVSYGIYLWHWPVRLLVNPARTGIDGVPLVALQLGLTLVLAGASYRFVELPIRQRRNPFRRRRPEPQEPVGVG